MGIGVGSSFIVLVSFTWGIFVFGEHVHSKGGACFAVFCMMMGLLGMAYYSSPTVSNEYQDLHRTESIFTEGGYANSQIMAFNSLSLDSPSDKANYNGLRSYSSDENETLNEEEPASATVGDNTSNALESCPSPSIEEGSADPTTVGEIDIIDETSVSIGPRGGGSHVILFGVKFQRRTLGILSAMFCGIYGGSIMAPMKWAPPDAKGMGYLISFAIGATTVNIALWVFRYLYLWQKHCSPVQAYYALPSFHIRKMWIPGGTAGLLWSIGNFFSILSVEFLGEGVGYSVVQASMLVSGLWGIFYFHEVSGPTTITKWFLSALMTVSGILLLSYEHHEK